MTYSLLNPFLFTIESTASWAIVCPEGPVPWYMDITVPKEIWVAACCIIREWSIDAEMVSGVDGVIASLEANVMWKFLEVYFFTHTYTHHI